MKTHYSMHSKTKTQETSIRHHSKKAALLAMVAIASVAMANCHKYCVCTRYTSQSDTFTLDELESMGYNCSSIEDIDGHDTYSVCRYE